MESHRAGQEERLVEIKMGTHSFQSSPAERSCCFRCLVALVAAMALIIMALVLGFIFHHFTVPPTSIQDAAPLKDTGKVSVTYKLKESDEKGRYDIFTAQKSSRYLIYGWVALTHITSDEVILRQVFNGNSRKIQKKESAKLVSFFNHTLLFNQTRISIYFNASCTDNLFHVHEL